jgi:hypothetical protein
MRESVCVWEIEQAMVGGRTSKRVYRVNDIRRMYEHRIVVTLLLLLLLSL